MASATRTAVVPLQGGVGYELSGQEQWAPEAVEATFDGTGAAGDFLACLSLYSPGGALMSRSFPDSAITAGDTAKVTYAPFLRKTAAGVTSAYTIVEDEGVPLTERRILDFAGAGVTATDDAANARTLVTIPGGGGGSNVGCRVYSSADQATVNNTLLTLAFDSERFDTDGIHDNAVNNSRLTCQTAGKYLIWGHAQFDINAAGYRELGIYFSTLTGFICHEYAMPVTVAGIYTKINLATVYELAVGEYVELWCKQTSGGALNMKVFANHTIEFGMTLLV